MKTKNIILILLVLVISVVSISSCGSNDYYVHKYGATLHCYVDEWIKDDFLFENKVKNAAYPDPDYIEGVSVHTHISDPDAPKTRTFFIYDKAEFDRIFDNCPLTVDFEKEMLVLNIDSDTKPQNDYRLNEMKIENRVLTLKASPMPNVLFFLNASTAPYARCFVLRMDKTDITEAVFDLD